MHIGPTHHEHGATAKVYSYEGDFEVAVDAINWKAEIKQGSRPLGSFVGAIPLTSPAVAALAEQAVRDDIVKRIDSYDDKGVASLDDAGG
ncbi:MAG TPA: hypothetical protein VJO99_08405 [Burkholderiaceae bacterium]|nr:hypothetical protein [Burkholderiaceae bacterium]